MPHLLIELEGNGLGRQGILTSNVRPTSVDRGFPARHMDSLDEFTPRLQLIESSEIEVKTVPCAPIQEKARFSRSAQIEYCKAGQPG